MLTVSDHVAALPDGCASLAFCALSGLNADELAPGAVEALKAEIAHTVRLSPLTRLGELLCAYVGARSTATAVGAAIAAAAEREARALGPDAFGRFAATLDWLTAAKRVRLAS